MTEPERRSSNAIAYNRVLEHYVGPDSRAVDLVGLVAYALYKRQKRDWLVRYREQHEGRDPSASDVAALTGAYLTDDLSFTLRERATDMLGDYARTFVEAAEPRIREDAIAAEALRQARNIERSIVEKSGFRQQVTTGLMATAIWTFFVLGLVASAAVFGSDIIDAWVRLADPSK